MREESPMLILLFLMSIESGEGKSKFESLYKLYLNLTYTISIGILENHADAEDAMIETWWALSRNIDRIGEPSDKKTRRFVAIVTQNIALNFLKQRNLRAYKEDAVSRKNYIPPIEDVVFEEVAEKERLKKVSACFERLPDLYKDVLQLYFTMNLSVKEIAKLLGRRQDTVKKQLQRAKKMFAEIAKEEGLLDD